MLSSVLRQAWRQRFPALPPANRVIITSATRMAEGDFWKKCPLGISLKKMEDPSNRLDNSIYFKNSTSLSVIYNRTIAKASRKDTLVFVHDDVWLDADNFLDALDAAVRHFEIVGVAGNRRLNPDAPAWPFLSINESGAIWDTAYLSGAVLHGNPEQSALSEYGPFPAPCELLDGVFLAARGGALLKNKIRFDERFDFHFYDLDFCRSARSTGIRLGTWGIPIIHESIGNFGSAGWQRNHDIYQHKWRQA